MPEVGILLNITPDHLDRHYSLEDYAKAKMRLFQGGSKTTFSVINGDDPVCSEYAKTLPLVDWSRFGQGGQGILCISYDQT